MRLPWMAGMGITILPAVAVTQQVAQGRLIQLSLTDWNFEVVTQVVRHQNKWLSPALNAFLDITRRVLAEVCREV